MFILIMQFLWKYVDDLMGKGLSVAVIMELMFYVSAGLIPLALPLSILLSSIMTFGNLAENNELTALKSSGLSLYRIIKPLLVVVIFIAFSTFYFSNYVIPIANLKWQTLIFDIQNTKITSIITPGVYSRELEGYAIKVDKGTEDEFEGIIIHDMTSPKEMKTIHAERGKIFKSTTGNDLYFQLENGSIMEELDPQPPQFTANGKMIHKKSRPSRRSKFKQATYKIDLSGFDLDRSREELFKDKYEMMNVFQINHVLDSVDQKADKFITNFTNNVKNDQPYFLAISYEKNKHKLPKAHADDNVVIPDTILSYQNSSFEEKNNALNISQSKLRNRNRNLKAQYDFIEAIIHEKSLFMIEFHRKYALSVAIVVLFFIGAPLGAIVRRGGFGAPVVIAAFLFMIYFVLITIGESLAQSGTVSPFWGMWFATFLLFPIAIYLMYMAANDRRISINVPFAKYFKYRSK